MNTIQLHSNLILGFMYFLSWACWISHVPLAVIAWRHRTHPVVSALFYKAVFICAGTVPLKILRTLDLHHQNPTVNQAYFLLFWIYEPLSDLLDFFIGYRLFLHLCDSSGIKRFTFFLSRVVLLTVVVSSGLLLSGGVVASHRALWWAAILTAKASIQVALCALVLLLVILTRSLGFAGRGALMRVALGLGVVASSCLISITLTIFAPHFATIQRTALSISIFGTVEMLGVMIGAILWCFAAHTLKVEERMIVDKKPSMIESWEQLDGAASLLAEIITR